MDKDVFTLVQTSMLVLMDIIGMVLLVFIMDQLGITIQLFVNMVNFGMDILALLQTIIFMDQVFLIVSVLQVIIQMDTIVSHHLPIPVLDLMFGMDQDAIHVLVMMLHLVKDIAKVELFGEDLAVLDINLHVHLDTSGMELLV